MAETVRVRVTTVSGEETLRFAGSGQLRRDGRSLHLRYTAQNDSGEIISAAVHWGAGRALLISDGSRLLLDPSRPTAARIDSGGGVLHLTVVTHHAEHTSEFERDTILLHYTLSAAGQILRELRVRLEFEPIRRETP